MIEYNILVIDDIHSHASSVQNALLQFEYKKENIYPRINELESFSKRIKEFSEARESTELYFYIVNIIEEYNISAIFLDLNHNSNNAQEDRPKNSSGELLAENLINNNLYKDIPIVIYTRFATDNLDIKDKVRSHVGKEGLISMEGSSFDDGDTVYQDFKDSDFNKIRVDDRVIKYRNREYDYDLAIVCALKEEFEHIIDLSEIWINEDKNGVTYKKTFFKFNGKIIKVIAGYMDDMGMVEAATYSTNMINNYKPKYIAMTGIAAGIENGDVKLGDILIPKVVWNWQSGKFKVVDKESYFDREHKDIPLSRVYKNALKNLQEDNYVKTLVAEFIKDIDKKSNLSNIPKIITENLVSGSAVVADSSIVSNIKARNLVGIDMEAYGLFYAADGKSLPIVIKSICDFANEEKNDEYHDFSAYVSAKTLYKLFTEYINY